MKNPIFILSKFSRKLELRNDVSICQRNCINPLILIIFGVIALYLISFEFILILILILILNLSVIDKDQNFKKVFKSMVDPGNLQINIQSLFYAKLIFFICTYDGSKWNTYLPYPSKTGSNHMSEPK